MESKRQGVSLGPSEGHRGTFADLRHQVLVWILSLGRGGVKATKSFEDRGAGSAVLEESPCYPLSHKPPSPLTQAS